MTLDSDKLLEAEAGICHKLVRLAQARLLMICGTVSLRVRDRQALGALLIGTIRIISPVAMVTND